MFRAVITIFFIILCQLQIHKGITIPMSMSMSTPRAGSLDIPVINPNDYFNSWRMQTTMPSLIAKKIGQIIDDYFKLKPELIKKQSQMKTLFRYNQKLMETVQNFLTHQKKLHDKYNMLAQLYVKTFKEYCKGKNWDINFSSLSKPMPSLFDHFSMSDWKFQVQQNQNLFINKPYQDLLVDAISRLFLNTRQFLDRQLQQMMKNVDYQGDEEKSSLIQEIKNSIREINTTPVTAENMFDLLAKRKNVEFDIRDLNEDFFCDYFEKDSNFIDEVARIHTRLLKTNPEQLKYYLQNENQVRRGLKKKSKKYRQNLQMFFEKIESENSDLKQESQKLRKQLSDMENQRNQFRSKLQYLQLKQGSVKKQKNANNTSLIEESLKATDNGTNAMKESNKKMEVRISELQAEIKKLNLQIEDKDEAHRHLTVKHQLMNSNTQMQELRLKLCSKLMQLGIEDTQAMTSGEMFDKLVTNLKQVNSYKVNHNDNSDIIDIRITDSIPFGKPRKDIDEAEKQKYPIIRNANEDQNLIQQPILLQELNQKQLQQSIPKVLAEVKQQNVLLKVSEHEQIHLPIVQEMKHESKESSLKESFKDNSIRDVELQKYIVKNVVQKQKFQQIFPSQVRETVIVREEPPIAQQQTKIKRKPTLVLLPSTDLLSISERKSIEQQSKMNDISKTVKQHDQKCSILIKEDIQVIKTIAKLKQQNHLLNQEIIHLREQLRQLQQKLNEQVEKSKIPKSIFSSLDIDVKAIKPDHVNQIQNLCQSLVKELCKLQGSEFSRLVGNMQQAIKHVKSSSSNNINQIPILSKMVSEADDNLYRSQTMVNLLGGKLLRQDQSKAKKRKYSINMDKSDRLSLKSGEVKCQIKYQKSIYFGKDLQPQQQSSSDINMPRVLSPAAQKSNNSKVQQESDMRMDQDQLIDIVNNFQGLSRKKSKQKQRQIISQNSLKLSQSVLNLKSKEPDSFSLKQSELKQKQEIKPTERKIAQDIQFLKNLQNKLDQIKDCNDNANDLYWFYKKYKQSIQALQRTQSIVRAHQRRKQTCTNKLSKEDSSLSRHKLEETIYFLQQKVNSLESLLQNQKTQYEAHMTNQLEEIDNLKEMALKSLVSGILTKNYLVGF